MLIELSGNVDNQRKIVLVNNEKKKLKSIKKVGCIIVVLVNELGDVFSY